MPLARCRFRHAILIGLLLLTPHTAHSAVCEVTIGNPLVYTAVIRIDTVANTATWLAGMDGSDPPDHWTHSSASPMQVGGSPSALEFPDDGAALREFFIEADWTPVNDQFSLGYDPRDIDWDQGGNTFTAANFTGAESASARLQIPTSNSLMPHIFYATDTQGTNALLPGWSVTVTGCDSVGSPEPVPLLSPLGLLALGISLTALAFGALRSRRRAPAEVAPRRS